MARLAFRLFAITCLVVGLASGARAGIVVFDFGRAATGDVFDSGDQTCYSGEVDGLRLVAHGFKGVLLNDTGDDVSASFDDREAVVVDRAGGSRGLSVDSENGDQSERLDGMGPDEAILFLVGAVGRLVQIEFDNFGSNDSFNLVVDGVVALVDESDLDSGDTWMGDFSLAHSFAIGADGANDEFRIRSISIAVPEPQALPWLLVLALSLCQAFCVGHSRGFR